MGSKESSIKLIRKDLLALTAEDLVVLSNRGLVKRAQQELQSGQFDFTLLEDEKGSVTVDWSDQVKCSLPSNVTVNQGQCSCIATTICRHIIRSVLIYQELAKQETKSEINLEPKTKNRETSQEVNQQPIIETITAQLESWNPGDISDEELAKYLSRNALLKAQEHFNKGQVVELVKSAKPTAYFHTLTCNLRFLVPKDLRYTYCDCAEDSPCSHVGLAVLAFRLLGAEKVSGIVSTQKTRLEVPEKLIDEIEEAIIELIALGVANLPKSFIDRLSRLENKAREEKLIWPAEIISEIIQQCGFYHNHNMLFSSTELLKLIGELCIRNDAIKSNSSAVPQLFVRGSELDKTTSISTSRLIGLGCGVKIHCSKVELSSYLQDTDSGIVLAISQSFAEPVKGSGDEPKAFWELARTAIVKDSNFASIGAGQVLIKGGKRTSDYSLIPGRALINVNPQAFNWEKLHAPLLAEDFSEINARFNSLPPSTLRPRRVAENFYVCAISSVDNIHFSTSEQLVKATLYDKQGNKAILAQPFINRASEGIENLLAKLRVEHKALRFISGLVQFSGLELKITPIALIFENKSNRVILQPWIDKLDKNLKQEHSLISGKVSIITSPITSYIKEVTSELEELILLGLEKVSQPNIKLWQELAERALSMGFTRFVKPIAKLRDSFLEKNHKLKWHYLSSAQAALELAVYLALVQDILV